MAVTVSGMFVNTWINGLNGTHVINLDLETHKCALYDNTITPNFSDTAANSRYGAGAFATGEISGTGYTAGGALLTSTTVTESPSGTIMWDAADVAWATSTITNARCCMIYADAITTPNAKPAIILVDFGAAYSSAGGTFTITWAAGGVMNWDVTP